MTDVVAMDVDSVGPSTAVPERKNKAKGGGKRFEIKKWNAVAMWSWAICTDTCAICRNNLYEPSIEYQVSPTATCTDLCEDHGILSSVLQVIQAITYSKQVCKVLFKDMQSFYIAFQQGSRNNFIMSLAQT